MNETKKTGIFWGVAAVVTLIAAIVAWPSAVNDDGKGLEGGIGVPLFAEFKDPLIAASLKIVTFNEGQGELKNFEVRKDAETGLWTIPSKGGYPADAVEQMRDAANALVALNVLDVPTDNPEDHPGMGVVEPKLEDLNPGDEGVGRLVTFKDKSQKVIASVIVGNKVKGQDGQVYVRKPGQDPVYVVALDDQPLSTKFDEWIEEDLLQLSSIDVEKVEIEDYNASLGIQGVSLTRNYVVSLAKEGSEWALDALKEYDKSNPLAEPTKVDVDPTKKLNAQKLNDLANALDDLKFVDVKRKPDGISANLKADKDFAADQDAKTQLAGRGFIPVPLGPEGEIEILSANGELTATTKDGVQYILRFGNISGISEESKQGDDAETRDGDGGAASGGVNRYLMVSTIVDESKFPIPELKSIPQTLEELDALDKPAAPPEVNLPIELNAPEEPEMKEGEAEAETTDEPAEEKEPAEETEASEPKEDSAKESEAETETPAESKEKTEASEKPEAGEPEAGEPEAGDAEAEAESGETDASGEGESTTVGEGQEPAQDDEKSTESSDEPAAEAAAEASEATEEPSDPPADAKETAEVADEKTATEEEPAEVEETEEEKLERLAAVQEKITKENDRKLEARKEQLAQAKLLSKALNERFADWYYVIPEDTYSKLRISRDDLFESADAGAAAPNPAAMPPGFGMPQGFPQGLPGN